MKDVFDLKKPLIKDYNLSDTILLKYKIQTLNHDYLIENMRLTKTSFFISIVYWLLNGGLYFILEQGFQGFLIACYIFPITVVACHITLMLFAVLVSSIISKIHPLTKQVKNLIAMQNELH